MAGEGADARPIGIAWDRMTPDTVLNVVSPVTVEGAGTLQGGSLTFKGIVDGEPVFTFQGSAKITGGHKPSELLRGVFTMRGDALVPQEMVVKIDGDAVGDGKVGPTARRLREEYVRFAAAGEAVT
jgi:hypothetical protein